MNWPLLRFFSTQKARREAQSTKFKVTPDTTVMHASVVGEWRKDSFECDVFRGPCHWNTNLILMEINKHAGVLQTLLRNIQPYCCYINFDI